MHRRQLIISGAGAGVALIAEQVAGAEAFLDAKKKPLPRFFKGTFLGGPFDGYIVDIAFNRTRIRGFARNEQVTQAVRLEQGKLKGSRFSLDLFHPDDLCAERRFGSIRAKVRGNKLSGEYSIESEGLDGNSGELLCELIRFERAKMRSFAGLYEATAFDGDSIVIGGGRLKLTPDGRYVLDGIKGKANCPKRGSGIWGMGNGPAICISPTFVCFEDETVICNSHVLFCPGVLEAPILGPIGPDHVEIHHPFLNFRGLGLPVKPR